MCGAGKFQNNSDTSGVVCSPCPPGRYLSDNGLRAEEHINASQCLPCAPGTYSTSGSASCFVCPGGHYTDANTEANTYCKECSPGKFNSDKAEFASKHDNENDCDVCPRGQISSLGDITARVYEYFCVPTVLVYTGTPEARRGCQVNS